MTQSATLQELRDRALDYADMPNSAFPDASRLDDYINIGVSRLHDLLIDAYQDYYLKTQTLTLVAGTETYDLPGDFYKSMEMAYISGNRRYGLRRFNRGELDGYRQGSVTGGTVKHWYAPQPVKLQQPTDKVSDIIVPGWEDYIALTAAVRLLIREESDPTALKNELAETTANIVTMAEPRDEGDQGTIEDNYGRFSAVHDNFRHWRYLRYRIMGAKVYFYEYEAVGV